MLSVVVLVLFACSGKQNIVKTNTVGEENVGEESVEYDMKTCL